MPPPGGPAGAAGSLSGISLTSASVVSISAAMALLARRNLEDAARAVGISSKTLLRWMKEPEFEAGYRAARRAAFPQSVMICSGCEPPWAGKQEGGRIKKEGKAPIHNW